MLASQLNPSSPVVNHLLLGRKPRAAPRSSRTPGAGAPPIGLGLPCTLGGAEGGGSPWRAHVRAHRRSLARARAQLGFVDSEELEEDEGEEEEEVKRRSRRKDGGDEKRRSKTERGGEGLEEGGVDEEEDKEEEEGENSRPTSLSPGCPLPGGEGEEAEPAEGEGGVEERLGSLDLASHAAGPLSPADVHPTAPQGPPAQVPILRPPPPHLARRRKGSDSSSDGPAGSTPLAPTPAPCSSSTMSSSPSTPTLSSRPSSGRAPLPSSPSTPDLSSSSSPSGGSSSSSSTGHKLPLFSPFPCVKQPRKSAAARNLGLYGPTSRTPTVHFPQLSRVAAAAASATSLSSTTTAATSSRRR